MSFLYCYHGDMPKGEIDVCGDRMVEILLFLYRLMFS